MQTITKTFSGHNRLRHTCLSMCGGVLLTLSGFAGVYANASENPISGVDVFGRLMVDFTDTAAENSSFNVTDVDVRRARLGVKGKFLDDFNFKLELNFEENGEVDTTDAYVEYQPVKGGVKFRAGHFKTPNSLEEFSSSRFISTLERSAFTDTFTFDRRLGVGVYASGKRHTLALGFYGDTLTADSRFGNYAVAGRATYEPYVDEDTTVFTGVSFRYRNQGRNQSLLRFRQRPATDVTGRILSTGFVADEDLFIGAELAVIHKSFWTTGELGVTVADCALCAGGDQLLTGGYAEVGYVLGGKRALKGGKYARSIINRSVREGGLGSLIFVARFDTIDLETEQLDGGSYNSITLGTEWSPTSHTRLGVNFYHIDADLGTSISGLDPAFSTAILSGVQTDDVEGVQIRAQFDF